MKLSFTTHESVSVIELPFLLTIANADKTRQALEAIMTDTGHHSIVLNMENVEFVDSSGLAVLVSAYKFVKKHNGKVAVYQPNKNVKALIELTRLHEILGIYNDLNNAIADLQQVAI